MTRPSVLTLRAPGLGDLLTVVPALLALADAFPRHRRVLATPAWLHPLAERLGAGHPTAAAGRLRAPGGAVERRLAALAPRRARGSALVPAAGRVWHPGRPPPSRRATAARRVTAGTAGTTLVHPGAASPARRWPAERFAAVARAERRRGRRVVVSGGPGEVELARRVAGLAGLPPAAALAGSGGLLALARAVAAAGRVVCGDTGVAHLATALGTPSVVLFGPVPPGEWGPPPDRPWHRTLWAGRRGDPHGLRPDPGLLRISVDEVLDALAALPGRPGGAERSVS